MAKYNLSREGIESLMDRLNEIAQGEADPEVTGLLEAPITTHFVKSMTKVKDIEDVIERNEQLSKTYAGFLGLYGFDEMYDMYLYAMSNDVEPLEKSEDILDHISVTRTITRNGKPLDVILWEPIYKSDDEWEPVSKAEDKKKAKPKSSSSSSSSKKPGEKDEEEEEPVYHAKMLKGSVYGEEGPMDPKHVARLKRHAAKMPRGNHPFNEGSKYYFELHGPEGKKPAGIAGFSEGREHMKMDFHLSDGKVHGVGTRAFFELIKLALKKEKGVKMEDHFDARPLFSSSGLERQKDGNWQIEGKDLLEAYGMEPKKK